MPANICGESNIDDRQSNSLACLLSQTINRIWIGKLETVKLDRDREGHDFNRAASAPG